MRLCHVETIVRQYGPCRNVALSWFKPYDCARERRRYAQVIQNYEPTAAKDCIDAAQTLAEDYVDALFTIDEATQLKRYLDRAHGTAAETAIVEVPLPVSSDRMSVEALPVGGGTGFHTAEAGRPDYSLPFVAEAYYDLRGCPLADGSGSVYHARYLIVCRDEAGQISMREETNEEAGLREAKYLRQ